MRATFDFALPKLLVHEGGYVNHPKDPGGATNKGVTQKVYDGYRRKNSLPLRSVRSITSDEVAEIYRKQYWDAIQGDELPQGVDYVVFDGAANSGPGQSVKWLQRALGPLYRGKIDGVVGEMVLGALAMVNDHDALIAEIINRREAFLRALRTFSTFGKGWMARIRQVREIGQKWASGSVGPEPTFFDNGNQKASLADAKRKTPKGAADGATGGGIATTTLGGALKTAQDTLTPLAGDNATISYVVTALVVTGVLATLAGIAYRYIAKRRDDALDDVLDLREVPA